MASNKDSAVTHSIRTVCSPPPWGEPAEASDRMQRGVHLASALAGPCGSPLGAVRDFLDLPVRGEIGEPCGRRDLGLAGFDGGDQLGAAVVQNLNRIGDQARRDIHLAGGFLVDPADGSPLQICSGVFLICYQ